MPRITPRQAMLDEVAQALQNARQQRLHLMLAEFLSDDVDLTSDPLSDLVGHPSSADGRTASPATSVSSLSSESSSRSGSPASACSFEQELQLIEVREKRLQATAQEIQHARRLQSLPPLPHVPQIHTLDHHRVHRPDKFRKVLRVNPETFDELVRKIDNHPIFKNNSNNPQLLPGTQLAIFLNRLGHYGNAAGTENIADWLGMSAGTVDICTYRVMVAILSLHDEAIRPPSDEDKARSQEYVESVTCPSWSGGILTGDGTLFPLYQKPTLHGEAWRDRYSNYSVNAQLISLPHNLLIVDFSVGHTGSAHDSYAFQATQIYNHHDRFLGEGEWMWGDLAYSSSNWMVAPFKKPTNRDLPERQRLFNYYLSKIRVRSEHAIGSLKNRFQSLKELRFNISSEKMHRFVTLWIICCIILHNLIIRFEESNQSYNMYEWWSQEDSLNDAEGDGDREDDGEQFWESSGQDLRDELLTALLNAL